MGKEPILEAGCGAWVEKLPLGAEKPTLGVTVRVRVPSVLTGSNPVRWIRVTVTAALTVTVVVTVAVTVAVAIMVTVTATVIVSVKFVAGLGLTYL